MVSRSCRLFRTSALCSLLFAAPVAAMAQGGGDSATVRLIQLLIAKGILNKSQAADLLSQAQQEAGTPAPRHARHAAHPASAGQAEAEPAPAPGGQVRVTYVPQFVRDQIAAQVRQQMLQQVETQGWAQPDALPEWTKRITLYGDLRARFQGSYQDRANVDSASGLPVGLTDFASINNSGNGFDTSGLSGLPPTINASENRNRFRVRARVGVRAQIADWISSDIRLATGSDNSPVSENQTLGAPGDFSKYAIWLDRAYLTLAPAPGLKLLIGRTPNPYFVSDLMYAPDLNFDGAALQYTYPLARNVDLFFNGGGHPVFNEALNFSSTQLVKGASRNAYLLAAQGGVDWRITHDYEAKLGAGYFGYSNVSGKLSAPCLFLTSSQTCSTDDTRPAFSQFGNTYFALRDIVTNSSSIPQLPEYYGLASQFGVMDLHGRFDIHTYDPVTISLEGEFIKNLLFKRAYVLSKSPVNNFGSNNSADPNASGPYQGGDTGYMAKLTVGSKEIARLWDWNLSMAYKYLETDSTIDAFTDPDFHLGGTNAKGYVLGGNLGIARNTWVAARWLSASQISGPPYGNDVLQIDLNTKF